MITTRELAILQVAIRYFEEEFLPHHLDAAENYFDEPLEPELNPVEILELRRSLSNCQLRYAGYDVKSFKLLSGELVATLDELNPTLLGPSHGIATIFFPTTA